MRQGGQREHQGHGVGFGSRNIWVLVAAICGLLVTGPVLGIVSTDLWLGPSWFGVITLALSVLLMGIVLKCFLETMAIGSGTGGAPSRGQ